MKRFLLLALSFALFMSMAGCRSEASEPKGTAFYYCVIESEYSVGSTALSAEYRSDVPRDSLQKALELYLSGPLDPDLQFPFPKNLKLIGADQEGSTVYLTFSGELADLSGLDLTIACGCLTLTALALTDAQQVEIRTVSGLLDGQRAIIMDKNTLLLVDTTEEGE